jgi:hypothetical protein
MVAIFLFFFASKTKEWQCFGGKFPLPIVIVPFPHKMSKYIYLFIINVHTHAWAHTIDEIDKKNKK